MVHASILNVARDAMVHVSLCVIVNTNDQYCNPECNSKCAMINVSILSVIDWKGQCFSTGLCNTKQTFLNTKPHFLCIKWSLSTRFLSGTFLPTPSLGNTFLGSFTIRARSSHGVSGSGNEVFVLLTAILVLPCEYAFTYCHSILFNVYVLFFVNSTSGCQ